MRIVQVAVLGGLILMLGGAGALAGGEKGPAVAPGADARLAVLGKALDVLALRMKARIQVGDTLRVLGRVDEALETYEGIERLYAEGLAHLQALLGRPGTGARFRERHLARRAVLPERAGAGAKPSDAPFAGAKPAPPVLQPKPAKEPWTFPEPEATNGVDLALRWLAAHQSTDGSWGPSGFSKWCDGQVQAEGPDGAGKDPYRPGVTGLALLAFLGAGHTNRGQGPYAKTVSRALRYLKNVQDQEGCFGSRTTQHFIYNHAVATLAIVEAYGSTLSPVLKASCQKALDFIGRARNPYFAWRYGVRPGDNDTSVTGWMTTALWSARLANEAAEAADRPPPFVVDEDAFDGARRWVDKMTDPDFGRTGYISRGGLPARPQEAIDRFPSEKSESMTAEGILIRVAAGEDPTKSEIIGKGLALLEKRLPTWNEEDGSIDMYYWFMGTLATYRAGGRTWRRWSDALTEAVAEKQRKDTTPCAYLGSWDPVGVWGPDGGRVYATALMALCLELKERYDQVVGTR